MEVNFEKLSETQGSIKIRVNRDDFQPAVNQKIKEYSKSANIKGFRPGKVPVGMIRKMYGAAIIVEEINKLVSEKLNTFLRESETHFLGEPLPGKEEQNYDWDQQQIFEFDYKVGFAKDFDIKLDKLKIDKYKIKIDNQVIDETIENLQRQFAEISHPEITTEKDTLYGKASTKDGAIEKEISIDLRELEKNTLKKCVGLKIGDEIEIDVKKSFKNDRVIKNQLRLEEDTFQKLKKFTFKLDAINHYKLSPIDQDFFDKTFGKDAVKNEEEFRDKVKEAVAENYRAEEEQFLNYRLREKATEAAKIVLPDDFLKDWLAASNKEITHEVLDSEYSAYSNELRWSLIVNEIADGQKIKVEHEDVISEAKALIKKQLAGSGIGAQMDDQLDSFANNYLQGEKGENYMKVFNEIRSKKVMDFIKDSVTIKDKDVSLQEFRKL
ncbi:MAG: trigger factor [Bacteroidota bacterium]